MRMGICGTRPPVRGLMHKHKHNETRIGREEEMSHSILQMSQGNGNIDKEAVHLHTSTVQNHREVRAHTSTRTSASTTSCWLVLVFMLFVVRRSLINKLALTRS